MFDWGRPLPRFFEPVKRKERGQTHRSNETALGVVDCGGPHLRRNNPANRGPVKKTHENKTHENTMATFTELRGTSRAELRGTARNSAELSRNFK